MNVLSITGIEPANAAKLAKELNQLLADFQVYYTNLRGFHWHVRGRQFFTLHARFENMYDQAAEHVDDIAERILQLGVQPENRFSEYLKVSKLKEETNVTDGAQIVKHILTALKVLIAQERLIADLSDELGDVATNDLVSDLLDEQEKLAWMLDAFEG